jgi:hypothetical protein
MSKFDKSRRARNAQQAEAIRKSRPPLTDRDILIEWSLECRSCAHWQGERHTGGGCARGECGCERSPFFQQTLGTNGRCTEHEPFNEDVWLELELEHEQGVVKRT